MLLILFKQMLLKLFLGNISRGSSIFVIVSIPTLPDLPQGIQGGVQQQTGIGNRDMGYKNNSFQAVMLHL